MKTIYLYIISIVFSACLLCCGKTSFAQDNTALYFSKQGQASAFNPAFMADRKFYFTIMGKTALDFHTSGFCYKDIINEDPNSPDSLRVDFEGFLDKLKKHNNLSLNFTTDIAALGFKFWKNYVSFGVSVNIESKLALPYGLIDFLTHGTDCGSLDIINNKLFDATAYTAAYIGYAREINDKLTVGIKFKQYNGIADIHTNKSVANFKFNDGDMAAYGDVDINTSFFFGKFTPVQSMINETSDFKFETEDDVAQSIKYIKDNKGYGLDLGFTYKLNDDLEFAASVTDFGKITWKTNTVKIRSKNPQKPITFTGLETTYNDIEDDLSHFFDDMGDSIKNTFDLEAVDIAQYSTRVPTKIFASCSWQFVPHLYLQGLYNGRFINSGYENSLTVNLALAAGPLRISVGNTVKYTMFNPNLYLALGNVFIGTSFSSYNVAKTNGLLIYGGWSFGVKNKKKTKPVIVEPEEDEELSFM